MPERMYVLVIVVVFLFGMLSGYFMFSLMSKNSTENIGIKNNGTGQLKRNQTLSIYKIEKKVLEYLNTRLAKQGIKFEISKSYVRDGFYAFDISILRGNEILTSGTVYATKDGKYLILNMVELSNESVIKKNDIDIENEPWMGDEDAEIVIVEFSGYDCPFCAKFALETLPKILKNFSVKVVFKDFPIHGEVKAHEAANCAGEQGKYWEYHDILFSRQAEWRKNESKFIDYARELGLNLTQFEICLNSGKYREEVLEDREEGIKLGVRGTPTFFINGKKVVGALPYKEFEKILKEIVGKT